MYVIFPQKSDISKFYFQILTILYGYGLNRLSDNVYIMTGSSMFGLSKVWLAAFLPGSMVPIMVSYFNHSNFYGEENLYANLHVHALILFITATVLNQIICLIKSAGGWANGV